MYSYVHCFNEVVERFIPLISAHVWICSAFLVCRRVLRNARTFRSLDLLFNFCILSRARLAFDAVKLSISRPAYINQVSENNTRHNLNGLMSLNASKSLVPLIVCCASGNVEFPIKDLKIFCLMASVWVEDVKDNRKVCWCGFFFQILCLLLEIDFLCSL